MGMRLLAAGLVLAAAVGVRAMDGAATSPAQDQKKTTRDPIYTKAQATRGVDIYVKHCQRCHDLDKVPKGKKPGPPVVGEEFLKVWRDRTLGELFGVILNTMPSDGTAFLDEPQTVDVLARLLQMNGFPDGRAPLKYDEAMKAIVIVK
jgi:cytochrome c5